MTKGLVDVSRRSLHRCLLDQRSYGSRRGIEAMSMPIEAEQSSIAGATASIGADDLQFPGRELETFNLDIPACP
jgi:hypothetical protein